MYPLFLSDLNKISIFSTYFRKKNTKFHENPPGGSRDVRRGHPDGKTDQNDEANRLLFPILRRRRLRIQVAVKDRATNSHFTDRSKYARRRRGGRSSSKERTNHFTTSIATFRSSVSNYVLAGVGLRMGPKRYEVQGGGG